MKSLGIWLAVTLAAFGSAAGAYHALLAAQPRLVLVAVDSSFEMRGELDAVRRRLAELETLRYARFALYSEKARLHGWAARLDPARLRAYGPRDLERLLSGDMGPEFSEADRVVVLSNASAAELDPLPGGWQLQRPR